MPTMMKMSNTEQSKSQHAAVQSLLCFRRPGKKYVLGLFAVQVVVIWFIYNKSHDLWSLVSDTPSPPAKKALYYSLYNSSLFHIPLSHPEDMLTFYYDVSNNVWCFKKGTDQSSSKTQKLCKCLEHWYGLDCGIPESVWASSFLQKGIKKGIAIKRRLQPRRIIRAVLYSGETDLLEISLKENFIAVDLFLIAENQTFHAPSLLKLLKEGYLSELQNKIMLINSSITGIQIDSEMQWGLIMLNRLLSESWNRLADFRPDDLFVFSHVSSIISEEILLFLKLYDGYSEPFFFSLRPLLYNFHRHIVDENIFSKEFIPALPVGCTFQYLYRLCKQDVSKLYMHSCVSKEEIKKNFEKDNWMVKEWMIGTSDVPSGWLCLWCCRSHQMKSVLLQHKWLQKNFNVSVIMLNNQSVSTLVISRLMDEGRLLDGTNISVNMLDKSDAFLAPNGVIDNPYRYAGLVNK